jgi:isoleucyl-tRNA synthetase
MYETYADSTVGVSDESQHVLDQWMISRVNETTRDITLGYENYELDRATRPIEGLIDDLSVWYLRRSRERLKGDDAEDKKACLATLRYVLKSLALLMSPVMPFYAEYLFQAVSEEGDAESVHLMAWPQSTTMTQTQLIDDMSRIRLIVTKGLEARQKANIKVRQPLTTLFVHPALAHESLLETESLLSLIKDEINVKSVVEDESLETDVRLDTVITPELKIEGEVRELMRAIQDTRKEMGLTPHDRIVLVVDPTTRLLVETMEAEVLSTVGADTLRTDTAPKYELTINGSVYRFDLER